ncbi:MAG: phage tail tape measure protein [Paracoccaceae bacterium]
MTDIAALTDQIATLETTLGSTTGMVSAFEGELSKMQDTLLFTGREVGALTSGFSGGLRRAFDGVVFDGMKLTDALKGVASSMSQTVFNVAMKPVQNAVGGFLANGLNALLGKGMPFANGGAFSRGRVMPFAKGGVVSSPTSFGMRGGTGLMGEAGPEAIMPLTRGADGKLGVQAAGGARAVTVVMNISTPDVEGFQRSQSQIAAQAIRALSRGQRNR